MSTCGELEQILTLLQNYIKRNCTSTIRKVKGTPTGVKKSKLKRESSAYNVYVKQKMAELKVKQPNLAHKQKMQVIGCMWRQSQNPPQDCPTEYKHKLENKKGKAITTEALSPEEVAALVNRLLNQ
jgi:hypothetical protein